MAHIVITIDKWNIRLDREISDKLAYKMFRMIVPKKQEIKELNKETPIVNTTQ